MKLIRRITYWWNRDRLDRELAEEIAFHQAKVHENVGDEARRSMGNLTLSREDARAVWIWPWLESAFRDAAYGARNLRRTPGFTLLALAVLGSAIGLNTSLFTAFNAIALRSWPVREPARVITAYSLTPNGRTHGFSIAEARYFGDNSRTLGGVIVGRDSGSVNLDGKPVGAYYVSGNYFDVLGVDMHLGRGFRADEDQVGNPQAVAVLGHDTWQTRFGEDLGIVGRTIRLDSVLFTIVGVAPSSFTGTAPERMGIWIPLSASMLLRPHEADSLRRFLTSPNDCCSSIAGRLAPGATPAQAKAELETLSKQFRTHHAIELQNIAVGGTAFFSNPGVKKQKIVPIFALMFLAVLLVLMLACANIGNLLLARAAARRSEIAIRLSLGAGRMRIIRQLLTESALLAIGAGAVGLVIAVFLPQYVFARVVSNVSFDLKPDWNVLAFTMLVAALACFTFGLAPALHCTRTDVSHALKGSWYRGPRVSLRSLLLAAQVALSVILLAGAGLLVRGVQAAAMQDPGFNIKGISLMNVSFPANSLSAERMRVLMQSFTREIADLGESVGMASRPPLSSGRSYVGYRLPADQVHNRTALIFEVSADYFRILGIPVVSGRTFQPADTRDSTVLVNETLARQLWPGEPAVGKSIIFSDAPLQVVGVMKDARTTDLSQVEPAIYQPLSGESFPVLLIPAGNVGLQESITGIVHRFDASANVRVKPLEDNLENWLKPSRVGAALASMVGLLALTLASIGVFGVFAYSVHQRTREIGIRMALGARAADIIGLVLASSGRALGVGFTLGIAGAFAGSQLLRSYLYGVSPFDPLAYAGVLLVMLAAGFVATYVPARRATRVQPGTALRYE